MKKRRLLRTGRSRAALFVACGVVLAGLVAILLGTTLFVAPASARPGNTCDPDPGHGQPGCHVEATTTTVTPSTVLPREGGTSTTAGGSSSTSERTTTGSTASSQPVTTGSTTPSEGPAVILDPSDPRPYVDQKNCLSCHGDPAAKDIISKQRPDGSTVPLYVDRNALTFSVHRFNDCSTCHGDKPHDADSPLTKLSLAEKCGSCHEYQYSQYIKSIHGAPQKNGNSDPATCTDCHSSNGNPHNIVRVLDPSASTYPRNIAQTCAKCHDDSKLMAKYGIVEKVYDSYMRSFHGKAISLSGESAALQQLKTATCVNCHGSHNIAHISDPSAPVAGMDNLAKTCEQCHPGAGVEFAKGFLGHKEADNEHIPQVFWGEKFFYVFTRVVLAGGVILVVGPFTRGIVNRIKRNRKPSKQEPHNEQQQEPQPPGLDDGQQQED